MKLVAMNEKVAAFVPSWELGGTSPDALLNKLMTVRSWKGLIDLFESPGVGQMLARRETEPLADNVVTHGGEYCHEPLCGQLNTWINRRDDIDFLDKLTKTDLLDSGGVYEVWVPELLSYAEDYRRLLSLAAVALGRARAPEDMIGAVDPYEFIDEQEIRYWFDKTVQERFRKGADIKYLSFNEDYWPASDYGPYTLRADECCFACELSERDAGYRRAADEQLGVFGFRIEAREGVDLYLLAYDGRRLNEETAKRVACGLIVSPTIGKVMWDEDSLFRHSYADLPEEVEGGAFSLEDGFGLAADKYDFTCWQDELTRAVENAVLSGRVTLCPYCGTPIIMRGDKDRVEYCCNSHKTYASKQRREKAIAMCLNGVPVAEAIERIGESYSESIARWYEEARELAGML